MNRGVFQSSPVQQAVAGAAVGWWSLAAAAAHENPSSFLQLPLVSSPLAPWADTHEQPPAESWSHLQLLCAEEEMRCGSFSALLQPRKVENWEDQQLVFQQPTSRGLMVEVKQEGSVNSGGYGYRTPATEWSHHQLLPPASRAASPASCTSSFNASMLDFSATKPADAGSREQKPEHTHECNSAATGTAAKKPRLQQGPSASQSTFKVRKEKLGDRITALHQLVSPFGKTDTASVLLEAIGYIRFLQNQIEALSSPYLGTAPSATRLSSSGQGERGCIFPEDPGQLLNDACMKRQGASGMDQMDAERERKKDLRSRGLCLVPVSCTMHMGSDNGADFWAPAIGGGVFR